jgi:octaheme c-type cytochrome (tetrathionate reductase family)
MGQRHFIFAILLAMCAAGGSTASAQSQPAVQDSVTHGRVSTADHTKFEILKRNFASGPEVTAACLSCHTNAADQVMHSIHWKWEKIQPSSGQTLGKRHVVNSFCGNVISNEVRCTSCHAGYGWDDTRNDPPSDPTRVDCLACHDRSGQYTKLDNAAGHPLLEPMEKRTTITGAKAKPVDLVKAAQSVGMPTRQNCGSCHFYGGGGDNVKHGDLSSALFTPSRDVDVHMSPEGQNFTCEACHVSLNHVFAGSRFNATARDTKGTGLPGERRHAATCESCHSPRPHRATLIGMKLNNHAERVACQTCHIPAFARGGVATKTVWDWSAAGKLKDGKPFSEEGFTQSDGRKLNTYLSTKGHFEWGENVVPHYAWFDGNVEYTLADQTIDPSKVVEINRLGGSGLDPNARIWPFKRMEGRQAYDQELNRLLLSHVYGPETKTAFWTNFKWDAAIGAAMKQAGLPFSGKFGFVDTHMYWPITHMVAPANQALRCNSCHSQDGRLAGIENVYMPGTGLPLGGQIGIALLAMAMAGVAGHGGLRIFRNAWQDNAWQDKGPRHG